MEEELYSMPEDSIQEAYDAVTSGDEGKVEQTSQTGTDKAAEESARQKTATDKIDESGKRKPGPPIKTVRVWSHYLFKQDSVF